MKTAKKYWDKWKHGSWIALYLIFYMMGFFILENAGNRHYHLIHTTIDDMIPFCEYFIVPYLLWFPFIGAAICWFIFRDKNKMEYYKLTSSLAIGMTVFLIVSCVYPNMQDMRPTVFAHSNIFTKLVQNLYLTDTPTNILPSIHVFNSLAVFFALNKAEQLQPYKKLRFSAGVLAFAIILATMFLKQHSVVDVSLGILMAVTVQVAVEALFRPQSEPVYADKAERMTE